MTQCLMSLKYGSQGRFSLEIDSERVVASPPAPEPNPRFAEELEQALAHPLDFPPLEQAVIPGDRVTIALDRYTPESPAIIKAVWNVLSRRDVRPEDVLILQPAERDAPELIDPRGGLPADVRNVVEWKIHDPESEDACTYLASSTTGERIYLARDIVDRDFVLPIGPVAYDSLLGYRGTGSVLYPGLSTADAIARGQGQGHHELGPDEERPLRSLIDEILWLLGVQFAIQVVPSTGGSVAHVLAGACDSVFHEGKRLLNEDWMVELETRPDIVVAAVDCDARGHGWEQIGAALETARNLVARKGKIVLLTELSASLGAGLEILRETRNPRDAIRPLRKLAPADLVAATQLAGAVEWADVYILSRLNSELVEDLFMTPLADEREAVRLLTGDATCLFLEGAQHTLGRIRG